jgi:hypothetical protein
VAVPHCFPVHPLFFAGWNSVDPETKRSVIKTQTRIDEINMRMLCVLRANLLAFDLHWGMEPAFRLFFGETNRFHKHAVAVFRSEDRHVHL